MNLVDIVILALVATAFVAICLRARRKGSCADCASAQGCPGSCPSGRQGLCPAARGVDAVAERLGRGVK